MRAPTYFKLFGRDKLFIHSQRMNALSAIALRLSGKSIYFKASHPINAFVAIESTEGIFISSKFLHPAKALLLITFNDIGRLISRKDSQL